MIELTLKISDKENGTPGEVCEEIQKAIENIPDKNFPDENLLNRFVVESVKAKRVTQQETLERRLIAMMRIIVANAKMIPDPAMQGMTDIYAVPLDDITEAQNILNEVI